MSNVFIAPFPTRETSAPTTMSGVLCPADPRTLSELEVSSLAEEMENLLRHAKQHPEAGCFVSLPTLSFLKWVIRSGWALVSRQGNGALEGCAYLAWRGIVRDHDGLGKRFHVFKFGGVAVRDRVVLRRYLTAVELPDFQDDVLLVRTHPGFGRILQRSGFTKLSLVEFKRKYRELYRCYFGRRRPNDERDIFVRFPHEFVQREAVMPVQCSRFRGLTQNVWYCYT